MAKEKNMTTTNVLLIIIIVILVGYIGYTRYVEWQNQKVAAAYNQGLIDAQTAINNQIIRDLNAQGYVSFTFRTSNNQTQSVRLGIVQDQTKN